MRNILHTGRQYPLINHVIDCSMETIAYNSECDATIQNATSNTLHKNPDLLVSIIGVLAVCLRFTHNDDLDSKMSGTRGWRARWGATRSPDNGACRLRQIRRLIDDRIVYLLCSKDCPRGINWGNIGKGGGGDAASSL